MALSNAYITLAEFKTALTSGSGVTGSTKDADMERAIEAASRSIDDYTRRRFWQDGSVVVRYYTAHCSDEVITDDISTSTGLIVATDPGDDGTFEYTWTIDTDFRLEPVNASADSEPWTSIERLRNGAYAFPSHKNRVKVTAKFGWATTPTAVKDACLIEATRLYMRPTSPFGVAGGGEFGAVRLLSKMDPDAEKLLKPYRRARVPGQTVLMI